MCTHADNHNTWAVAAMDSCLFCSFLSWFFGGYSRKFHLFSENLRQDSPQEE